jgi:hypothetical protein
MPGRDFGPEENIIAESLSNLGSRKITVKLVAKKQHLPLGLLAKPGHLVYFLAVVRIRRVPDLRSATYRTVVTLTARDRFAVTPATMLRVFLVRLLYYVAVRRHFAQARHIFLVCLAGVPAMFHGGFLLFGHHCRTVAIVW